MFDDIHLHAGPSETRVTKTVHEHRAPTDDSVKLLIELTEKARSNLIATFGTSNNTLQATWAHYEDMRLAQTKYLCKFTLNGKDHQIVIDLDQWEGKTKHQQVEKLYERLCAQLAADMMLPLLEEMKGKVKF